METENNTPTVTVIPATINAKTFRPLDSIEKKRVAAYARVSSDTDEQLNSYEAQVDYYTNYIKSKPEWEFVEVYADEGITGTNTKRRGNFNRMVEDALAGKIDLIITKSVARFARNTVDTISIVRDLRTKGIEVYFEKENIYSLDPKCEMVLGLMAMLAQEESRSISENVKWGHNKRMRDGRVYMSYKHFLGYEKGIDGAPAIVESEAAVVRRIYSMFLEGNSYRDIAVCLTNENIPTPAGRKMWRDVVVKSILANEKYAGNAILQKYYTTDFLTKKTKINEGEIEQYYVEDSHPAIIPQSTYELVQGEIKRREKFKHRLMGSEILRGRIVCGHCSSAYGSKTWHSSSPYSKIVWQCNAKYRKQRRCTTPHVSEEQIQQAFLMAWSELLASKGDLIAKYEAEITQLEDETILKNKKRDLLIECAEAAALVQECINQNAVRPENQEEYNKRHDELAAKHEASKTRLEALAIEKKERLAKREKLHNFIQILQREEGSLDAFDDSLWRETVETVTIYTLDNIVVRFRSEDEIKVSVVNPSA